MQATYDFLQELEEDPFEEAKKRGSQQASKKLPRSLVLLPPHPMYVLRNHRFFCSMCCFEICVLISSLSRKHTQQQHNAQDEHHTITVPSRPPPAVAKPPPPPPKSSLAIPSPIRNKPKFSVSIMKKAPVSAEKDKPNQNLPKLTAVSTNESTAPVQSDTFKQEQVPQKETEIEDEYVPNSRYIFLIY